MTRRGLWPYLILGLALLGVGVAFWRPVPAGVWHDDGVYVLVGRALAHGQGFHYVGVPGDPPAVKFPPVYPVFLAGLWLIFGSIGPVSLAAQLMNLVFLAMAGVVTAWVLRRHAGFSLGAALAIAAVAFTSADVWRPALVTLSEPLFMLVSALALAAWGLAAKPGGEGDRRRYGGIVWLAVALVAAVLTRSAGLAVVLGCGVALALTRSVRAAVAATLPALATVVAWGAFAASRARQIPPGAGDVLGPYGGWLAKQVLGAPKIFLADLPWQATALGSRLAALLVPGPRGWPLAVAAVPLAALAIYGWALLLRRFPPLAWSLGAYLAMLMVWPFVDRRLVVPAHPWVVAAVGCGVLEAVRRFRGRARQVLIGAVAVWVGAFAVVTASRVSRGWAAAGYRLRAGRLATAMQALNRTAPPGSVVGAPEFWPAVILHGDWQSIPSARFTPRSEEEKTPVWGTPDQQLHLWWHYRVGYVLLEENGVIHGDALTRLEGACPGTVVIVAKMSAQMLVRLGWDETCAAKLGLTAAGS